jgi:phage N-6-adenine-methyltransferase
MKRNLAALVTSKADTWGTPVDFYEYLDRQFAFTIDVCALESNAKHPRFFSPKENGLVQSWAAETAFANFPYGRGIGQWIDKARDEAMLERALVVQLLPARVDTDWWRTFVMSADGAAGRLVRSEYDPAAGVLWLRWAGLITGVYFHSERLCFEGMADGRSDSAPFPSAIVIHSHPSRRPPAPKLEPDELCLTTRWPR